MRNNYNKFCTSAEFTALTTHCANVVKWFEGASILIYRWRQMRQGQFWGNFFLKFNKFQYTKIRIIIAVK